MVNNYSDPLPPAYLCIEEYVFWAEVAVSDAVCVEVGEALQHFKRQP